MPSDQPCLTEDTRLSPAVSSRVTEEGKVIVLEVEHIAGDWKILVTRDGKVSFAQLKTDAKPMSEQPMPSLKFWEALQNLMKDMLTEHKETDLKLAALQAGYDTLRTNHMVLLEHLKEKKKFIPVGASKKEMFAAGVSFGKNMRK